MVTYIMDHPVPSPHFLTPPPGGRELKKNMAVGVINQGVGGGREGGAEQRSAWQLCAANLWHTRIAARQLCAANLRRTLCASIVRDNCALHTCGAYCVPVQCTATVRCKLAAHIVCQNSARQMCAAYLRRTLWARTVRQKRNLHTKNAFAANLPQLCAANLSQVCGIYVPETLYFGKGDSELHGLWFKLSYLNRAYFVLYKYCFVLHIGISILYK